MEIKNTCLVHLLLTLICQSRIQEQSRLLRSSLQWHLSQWHWLEALYSYLRRTGGRSVNPVQYPKIYCFPFQLKYTIISAKELVECYSHHGLWSCKTKCCSLRC